MAGAGHRLGLAGLNGISLDIAPGEYLALLGPPDAGKTALLRTIAGRNRAVSGMLVCDGRDVTRLRARRRGFGLVLHEPNSDRLSLARALDFSLRLRRVRRAERVAMLAEALDLAAMSEARKKRPQSYSDSERWRATLARALIHRPGVLLLDTPPEEVDPAGLHRYLTSTIIVATRDAPAAMRADRIAILRAGRLVTVNRPAALYDAPGTRFVASLLGRCNFLSGTLREKRVGAFIYVAEGTRLIQAVSPDRPVPILGEPALLALRPERIALLETGAPADNAIEGTIVAAICAGAVWQLAVATKLGTLLADLPSWRAPFHPAPGMEVRLGWAADASVPVQED